MHIYSDMDCNLNHYEEKKNTKAEKEAKKKEIEMEKMVKKAMEPNECLKYITAIVDLKLLELPEGSEIISKLHSLDVSCRISEQTIPLSIIYKRRNCLDNTERTECERIVFAKVEEFISKVYFQLHKGQFDSDGSSLSAFCKHWLSLFPQSKLFLVVYGLDDYFKKNKSSKKSKMTDDFPAEKKVKKRQKNTSDHLTSVTRIDVETAIIYVQEELSVSVNLMSSPSKVADFVSQVAKSVAEKPYRLSTMVYDFDHCFNVGKCVKVETNGANLLALWQSQLQQIVNVGAETVQAITAKYSSPQDLIQAYRRCSTEEGMKLLADIPVRRGVGILANSRRVGGELSKLIYQFFTDLNPETVL